MIRSWKVAVLASILAGAGGTLRASSAILDCTGDTWIDSRQPDQRHARDLELHLQGRQKLALLNFHFPVVRDWKVERATLLLHLDDITPLKILGIAAAPKRWNEVEATAMQAAAGTPWTAKGLLADSLGRFDKEKANWRPVKDNELGWVEVDVPPALVEECAAGRAEGLVLFVRLRDGERIIHSRDSVRYAPMLKVEGTLR